MKNHIRFLKKTKQLCLLARTCLLAYLSNVISHRPSTVPTHPQAKYAPAAMAESTEEKVHNCKLQFRNVSSIISQNVVFATSRRWLWSVGIVFTWNLSIGVHIGAARILPTVWASLEGETRLPPPPSKVWIYLVSYLFSYLSHSSLIFVNSSQLSMYWCILVAYVGN